MHTSKEADSFIVNVAEKACAKAQKIRAAGEKEKRICRLPICASKPLSYRGPVGVSVA